MVDRALEAYNWVSRNTTAIHNLIVAGPARGRSASCVVAASDAPADWISQADYTCDGTDDDVQINAALVAAGAGNVLLSPGTFHCTSTITMGSDGVLDSALYLTLFGTGKSTIISNGAGSGVYAITGGTLIGSCRVSNLRIAGDGANSGIKVQGNNWEIDNIEFSDCTRAILLTTASSTATYVSVSHCKFNDCGATNAIIIGNFAHVRMTDLQFFRTSAFAGMDFVCTNASAYDLVFDNITSDNNNSAGSGADRSDMFFFQNCSRITLNNIHSLNMGHHGIYFEAVSYLSLSNIIVENAYDIGICITESDAGADCYYVNISNVQVINSRRCGILLYGITSCTVENAQVISCGGIVGGEVGVLPNGIYLRYATDITLTNVHIRESYQDGLYVEDTVTDLRVVNCSFIDNGQQTDDTYSGVSSNNANNVITMIGCASYNSDGAAGSQKYGVSNTAGTVNSIGSRFSTNHTRDTNGTITTLVGLADT